MKNTNKGSGLKELSGILKDIVLNKQKEIERSIAQKPVSLLEASAHFGKDCKSFESFLKDPQKTGIIAEFKRASPSKGMINNKADVKTVTKRYSEAGASALSVLTDQDFFKGSEQDLKDALQQVDIPVLRKDFIIDHYQVIETKAMGADIILLIAAILQPEAIHRLSMQAKSLGLNVLLEVHSKEELEESLCDTVDAVGVNNRDLRSFSVSAQRSSELIEYIPKRFLKISESGISHPDTINKLRQEGFDGFLIGETFMKEEFPGLAFKHFAEQLAAGTN